MNDKSGVTVLCVGVHDLGVCTIYVRKSEPPILVPLEG